MGVAQDDYIDEFGNVMEEPEDEEAQQAQEVDDEDPDLADPADPEAPEAPEAAEAEDDFWNQEQEGELEQDQADVAQDDYIDEFGNVMEEPEDEEAQQAQEVDMPHREGD